MIEIKGSKYSLDSFDEYKIRATIRIHTTKSIHRVDIYTTDTNRDNVENVLIERRSENTMSVQIVGWVTREQDDSTAELIDEMLKEE